MVLDHAEFFVQGISPVKRLLLHQLIAYALPGHLVTSLNVSNACTMASHTTSMAPYTVTLLVDITEFMFANPPPHIMFPRPRRQV